MLAKVRGYVLEVPDGWHAFTDEQRAALQNGVGPEHWDDEARETLDKVTGLRAAADIHDVDYCLGLTSKDRKIADKRFFRNCLRIIRADVNGMLGLIVNGGFTKAFRRIVVARTLYRALRTGGKKAFNASPKFVIDESGTPVPKAAV